MAGRGGVDRAVSVGLRAAALSGPLYSSIRLLLPIVLLFGAPAGSATPLETRAWEAAERALDFFRGVGASNWGRATPVVAQAFLRSRSGPAPDAPVHGWDGLGPADRELVLESMRYCTDRVPGIDGGTAWTYRVGACLEAMADYVGFEGPDDVGGQRGVADGMERGVEALRANRHPGGGWRYINPAENGDLSATRYAVAGLVAASGGAADDLVRDVAAYVDTHRNDDGSFRYHPRDGQVGGAALTASAAWIYAIAGIRDARLDDALSWIARNPDRDAYPYSAMWAGYVLVGALPDALVGRRDPVADGNPEDAPGFWYDATYALLGDQRADGSFCRAVGCRDHLADTAHAVLVLSGASRRPPRLVPPELPDAGPGEDASRPEWDAAPTEPPPVLPDAEAEPLELDASLPEPVVDAGLGDVEPARTSRPSERGAVEDALAAANCSCGWTGGAPLFLMVAVGRRRGRAGRPRTRR